MIWFLAGCHQARIEELDARVASLRTRVDTLEKEVAALQKVLAGRPPPTRSARKDNDPPGFDADKPLPAGAPGRPDVILLSIDTLRADHLGTYGYDRPTSPFFDELGAGGTVFESAWSPTSWTLPSHTTMLSGWLPIHHGAVDDHLQIPPDLPLLQEAFQDAGWGTIGAVATLFVSSRFGFERGFDHFVDFGIKDKHENNLSTVDADHVFHNALAAAQRAPEGKPLFLFLHVYDAHYQYDPPPPWNEKFDRKPQWGDEVYKNYHAYQRNMVSKAQLDHQVAQYDEEIAFVDAMFRDFVERWRRSGREAVVIVTADHGEEFGERGSWGHAHTLYPEQLHVPLLVNGPGVAVQRIADRVGTEDLAPTVAALAGVPFDTAKDGVSRADQVRGGAAPDHASAPFADTSRFDSLVVRWHEPPYDLVVDMQKGKRELFDLTADPLARSNIYKGNRPLAEAMFTRMSEWLGEPWTVQSDGLVEVQEGIVFAEAGDRKGETWTANKGQTFSVLPGDATVRFRPVDGSGLAGPWRPFGGTVPGEGCPVTYSGRFLEGAELSAKSEDERAMLEALGYLQNEGGGPAEGADLGAPKSGREPCGRQRPAP